MAEGARRSLVPNHPPKRKLIATETVMNSPKYIKSTRSILIIVWFAPWYSKSPFFITVIIANTYLGPIKFSQCFIYINLFNIHSNPKMQGLLLFLFYK